MGLNDFDKSQSILHTRISPVISNRLTGWFHGDNTMPNTDIKLSAEYQNDYRKKQKRN